ncbi:MAG: cytoplasmic membrane [Bacteroidetes bacterium]|nr:MAG: cytoplasmic membrane [Bacteroidota bacterium]
MKTVSRSKLFRGIGKTLGEFLSQGLTPEMMSRTIATGLFLGTIPIPGISTVLCTILAVGFRMNLALIQFVNYLVFPLQFLLFFPLYSIASKITGKEIIKEIPEMLEKMSGSILLTASADLLWLFATILLVWIAIMFPVSVILYFSINPILIRIKRNKSTEL